MKIAPIYGILLGLSCFNFACGDSSKKNRDPIPDPGLFIDSGIEPRMLELEFADPSLKQEIAVSPVSLMDARKVRDNLYSHSIGFKITNLLGTTRCFIKLQLEPDGYEATDLMENAAYVDGSLMDLDSIATNTCLAAGESGFILTYLDSYTPEIKNIKLLSIEDNSWSNEPTPLKQVSVVSEELIGSTFKVVLRNDAMNEGFSGLAFTMWIVTSGERILEWGFLDTFTSRDKDLVKINETLEITGDTGLPGPLPEDARLHIVLDRMLPQLPSN